MLDGVHTWGIKNLVFRLKMGVLRKSVFIKKVSLFRISLKTNCRREHN